MKKHFFASTLRFFVSPDSFKEFKIERLYLDNLRIQSGLTKNSQSLR